MTQVAYRSIACIRSIAVVDDPEAFVRRRSSQANRAPRRRSSGWRVPAAPHERGLRPRRSRPLSRRAGETRRLHRSRSAAARAPWTLLVRGQEGSVCQARGRHSDTTTGFRRAKRAAAVAQLLLLNHLAQETALVWPERRAAKETVGMHALLGSSRDGIRTAVRDHRRGRAADRRLLRRRRLGAAR